MSDTINEIRTSKEHEKDMARTQEGSAAADQKQTVAVKAGPPLGPRPACFRTTAHEIAFVAVATFACGMAALSTGTSVVVTSFIAKSLDLRTSTVVWIAAAPSLVAGSFLLPFGRSADLFGRRSLLVSSLFVFAFLSLGAGFVKNGIVLDTLLGLMGLAGAAGTPAAVGILGNAYEKPSRRKNYAFAAFSSGNPIGFVLGTIFSGIAAAIFDWRASFFLLAIIFGAVAIFAVWAVPKDTTPRRKLDWELVKELDIVGTLATIGGIGMFSAALTLGANATNGWQTPYVIALLVVGIVLMIFFVFWEMKYSHPLVPMHIWLDRDFSLLMILLTLGNMGFIVATFFIALYFQEVWQFTALGTAVHLLPMCIMGILVNVAAGAILHRVSNKLLTFISSAAFTLAFLLMALHRGHNSFWAFFFPAQLLAVIGADLQFNVSNMYVMSSMAPTQQSIAGGIFQTITRLCSTLGFGIATAVFNSASKPSMWPTSGYYAHDSQWGYTAVWWYSTVACAIGIPFVYFLRLGTQGNSVPEEEKPAEDYPTANASETDVPADTEKADHDVEKALSRIENETITTA